jgi:membrane protease YdiL (CAAX protease family)
MKQRSSTMEAVIFAAITIGLSYLVFWGPIALAGVPAISFVANVRGPVWAIVLFLLGGFVPSVVAIVLTRVFEGGEGLRILLRRTLQFNLGWRWYLATFLIVALGAAGQILINRLLGNSFNISLYLSQLPSFIPLIIIGPLSEEYGWRGYFLYKLQQRWNALSSSIVVGIIWGLWHLPLFFMVGTSQHELRIPFISFLVGTITISVLMTWINNNTRNSIWAAIFLHWLYTYTAQVNSTGVIRSAAYNWLEMTPYLLIALVVLIIWGPKRLTRINTKAGEAITG